jgi:hypothetical protein
MLHHQVKESGYLAVGREGYDTERIVLIETLSDGARRMLVRSSTVNPFCSDSSPSLLGGTGVRSFMLSDTSINSTISTGPRLWFMNGSVGGTT